ncbi:methyltransferase family protein [Congregibacter litoralis]|uniref:methyltransferase family protein n=1 Tax=Congregibacter litoralis TaxID=393662 RepID=UPI00146FB732|nr:PEMT/PEM2 methyltransferase family protein [Congregibacter litoralis]
MNRQKNRLYAGLPLFIIGFGCALFWTNYLGWRNAFGKPDGLRTSGVYRFSRNPIYLASIIGMVGWAIVVPSWKVTVLLSLWAALYIVAPWVEDPWMTKKYGKAFVQYRERTPRFL